jgi:hypothetical protein
MEAIPSAVKDGLTFFPIPVTTDLSIAFGLGDACYFNRRALPDVPKKYVDAANDLFFNGGKLPDLAPQVDRSEASRFLRAMLASFAPSHESKETTAGYALWVWSTPEALALAGEAP